MSNVWFGIISEYFVHVDVVCDDSHVPRVLKDYCFIGKKWWIKDEYYRQWKITANPSVTYFGNEMYAVMVYV